MSVEIGIWRIGEDVERVDLDSMPSEQDLENVLVRNIAILDPDLLLIGRQVITAFNKRIDLLAMDAHGHLVVIELKRDRTPRDVVAQLLDYGSWVQRLKDEDIVSIFNDYQEDYLNQEPVSLDQSFKQKFQTKALPECLNEDHRLVVVSSELDASTERIVNHLEEKYHVRINALFFRYFKDGDQSYLARTWLIDPEEAESRTAMQPSADDWNGEFYVSFGEYSSRKWEDARQYGYIAAGSGRWYSSKLDLLKTGDRIWVNMPGEGYVGVGEVTADNKVPITEFTVLKDSRKIPVINIQKDPLPTDIPEDELEYYVPVKWLHTVPVEDAIKEVGFFGNQNIVAQPVAKKWRHTVDRLKILWKVTS